MIDRDRITNYPRIFVALYVVIGGWWLLTGEGLLDRAGKPIGADFVTFYAAARVADPWDLVALHAAEKAAIGADVPAFAWHYPPTLLLLLTPLRWLPYLGALAAWLFVGTVLYVALVRRLAPDPAAWGLALAFPGYFQNVLQGQNGLYTTAIVGTGLLLVERRPALAGAVLGLASIKPHLAPVIVLALLAGRRWRAVGGLVVSTVALGIVAALVLGMDTWRSFLDNASFALRVLETPGELHWSRMPTVQVATMGLGASIPVARAAQAVAAVGATVVMAAIWARGAPLAARGTALVAAILLTTPFAFDYDLALYAIPIALLARRAPAAILVAAWLAPLAVPAIAVGTGVQLGPVVSAALLWAAWRERAVTPP